MVIGGPLCGWLLGIANPLHLAPWRFMFVLIAVPNLLLAFVAAARLVDRPDEARWLSRDERDWLAAEFTVQQAGPSSVSGAKVPIARDPWLWRSAAAWLLIMTGSYALVFWLPQLVRQIAIGGSEFVIATLSAVPLLGLAIGLVANGRHSDRTGERLLHVSLPSAFAGGAMLVAAALAPGWAVLGLLTLAGLGIGAAQGVFWAIPGAVRIGGGAVPAGAIAWISMAGTAGGIIGPYLTGALLARSGSFSLAIALLASLLIIVLLILAPFNRKKRDAIADTVA
jgi:ACS family tartrate transporter-like MFS transporter